ncbi:MAG: class I fructose-bisphosphate aldolase [Desulfurococcaceae archaeon]
MSDLTYNAIGKKIRFNRIIGRGRAVIFAFDHGVEHGPSDFTPETINPRRVIEKVVGEVDAIMMLPGIAKLTWDIWANKVALIVKVTSKTNLRPEQEKLLQSPFGLVEEAVTMGADGVAATVYWGSQYEDKMLEQWISIRNAAETYGLPCLQLAYPRGPSIKNMYDVEIVKYGARAAAESGADLIKTYYTGSAETFKQVVEAASGVPVLMSGGPKRNTDLDFLIDVYNVIRAGGRGVVVGRNVFQHTNPRGMLRAIRAVVYEDRTPEEAVKLIQQ